MTNLFTRIKNSVTADLHEALDQKEKKNPITLLNQYLRQCEQETEKVRKLVERQHSLIEEFSKENRQAAELAEKRKHQSEIASQAGETGLYEFALSEYQQYTDRASHLSKAVQQAKEQLTGLERKYGEMAHKLKDMQIRRMELMGRENVSNAYNRINKVLDPNSYSEKSFSRFEEIESYLERLEKQVTRSHYRDTIDERIAQLEKELKFEKSKSLS